MPSLSIFKAPPVKFRSIQGKNQSIHENYGDIKTTFSPAENRFVTVNCKFFAAVIETSGGGAFVVGDLEKVSSQLFIMNVFCQKQITERLTRLSCSI